MNEKFFKLPKEKRLCIINAGLEVFSQHDYKRAVTDDIAAKAGISKGLLFYYFHNKGELYRFLFDYGLQALREQVVDERFSELTDFFELLSYAAEKKMKLLTQLPYLFDFTIRAYFSKEENVLQIIRETTRDALDNQMSTYFKNVDLSKFREGVDLEQIMRMMVWMTEGYMQEKRRSNAGLRLEQMKKDFNDWVNMFRKLAYREEYL